MKQFRKHTHTDIQQWSSPLHYQEPGRCGLYIWSQWTIAAHRSRIRGKPQPKAPNSRRIQLLQKPVQASTCLRKSLPKEEWLRNTTTPSSSLSLTRVLIIYQLISTQDNSMRQILLISSIYRREEGPEVQWCHMTAWITHLREQRAQTQGQVIWIHIPCSSIALWPFFPSFFSYLLISFTAFLPPHPFSRISSYQFYHENGNS